MAEWIEKKGVINDFTHASTDSKHNSAQTLIDLQPDVKLDVAGTHAAVESDFINCKTSFCEFEPFVVNLEHDINPHQEYPNIFVPFLKTDKSFESNATLKPKNDRSGLESQILLGSFGEQSERIKNNKRSKKSSIDLSLPFPSDSTCNLYSKHTCNTCGITYAQVITEEKSYKCHNCNVAFSQVRKFENNQSESECGNEFNLSHTSPDKINTCDKKTTASSRKKKNRYEKIHHCNVCGKAFRFISHLIEHERIHTGEKLFHCETCGKGFCRIHKLREHERVHTGERPFECTICGLKFARKLSLRRHKITHTGEKPYECKTCGKHFGHSSSLKSHERIHTGEKPYKCIHCGKGFTRSNKLNDHERIHTGNKPYNCSTCGKGFGNISNLRRHMRVHS